MKIFGKGWGTLWLALGLALLTGIAVLVRPPLSIPPYFESYDTLGWNLARGAGPDWRPQSGAGETQNNRFIHPSLVSFRPPVPIT